MKWEWIDKDDFPADFDEDKVYITYQTGKGSDHLEPVSSLMIQLKVRST